MHETRYRNRRAFEIENDAFRVTVAAEGGHIAEILHKVSGVNPLWNPPWPTIEPSTYEPQKHREYGNNIESSLLCGILGHNLCLDLFGPPSPDEEAAGIPVHGESNILAHEFSSLADGLTSRCIMPRTQLAFERTIRLSAARIWIEENVENLWPLDRPIAWQQHVTLGPPFLELGATQFRAPATRSRAIGGAGDFDWPWRPLADGRKEDLRVYIDAESSGGFTTHLMDPALERSYFFAFAPVARVLLGYVWRRSDFPWLGIWEENRSRIHAPWNGRTLTRGMEFGASPFPETRRQMIERGRQFDTLCYRWIPARSKVRAEYYVALTNAPTIPETLEQFESIIAP
jgi:hypothetical protein